MRTNSDFNGAPFADSLAHGLTSEAYLKCDWCGAPASFWIRQKNYCGDCLAARLPENKPEKDWWPAVQQVAAPAALAAKVREAAPTRAKPCAGNSPEMQAERVAVLKYLDRGEREFPKHELRQ